MEEANAGMDDGFMQHILDEAFIPTQHEGSPDTAGAGSPDTASASQVSVAVI
jgi:hypothetical protein